jgi:hypothetical protein
MHAGRRILTRLSPRATNLGLFVALALVFATGLGAVMTGSARGAWIVVAHGIVAITIILMIPWKTIVIRRGLRRRRASRWMSLALVPLVLATLVLGLVHGAGLVRDIGGFGTLWLHIAVALALVPPLLGHVVTRPIRGIRPGRPGRPGRRPARRPPVIDRRAALRAGALVGLAAALYAAIEGTLKVTGAPGARRRFTGSHRIASTDPAAMPVTSWLDDRTPTVDGAAWRLVVVDGAGRRELTLATLAHQSHTLRSGSSGGSAQVRATLDCTSGWYAEHDWSGIPVCALLTPDPAARSLYVHSVTGYWARFPVGDIDTLLLATEVAGQALSPGHGYPLRLVAPGRRGFWWVKWVDRIEFDTTPSWWHPPLPVT